MKSDLITKSFSFLLTLLGVFIFTSSVNAQMTSDNYTINSYVVGSENSAYATSSNYTTVFGVDRLEYNATEAESDSGSSGGSGSRSKTPETNASSSTPSDIPANNTVTKNVVPSPTNTPGMGNQFVTVPETISDLPMDDCLILDPSSQSLKDNSQSFLQTHTSLYKVLDNGIEVRVDLPKNAFNTVASETQTGSKNSEVCFVVKVMSIPREQYPEASYVATLVGGEVYVVSAFNAAGKRIDYFNQPIVINFSGEELTRTSKNLSVYEYSERDLAWVLNQTATFESRSVTLTLEKPQILAFFYSETTPDIMYLYPSVLDSGAPQSSTKKPTTETSLDFGFVLLVGALSALLLLLAFLGLMKFRKKGF